MTLLTWLYAPADRPEIVAKALAAGADAVVVDLQDAVAADRKDTARGNLVEHLAAWSERAGARGVELHVRVNEISGDQGVRDLAVLRSLDGIDVIRVPRVEQPSDLDPVREAWGDRDLRLHPLIETARGLRHAFEIAAAPDAAAISLGEGDLSVDLGVADEEGLAWARSRLVVAAAAAGLPAPSMSVFGDLSDARGLADSCALGRRLGMRGRAAIHPRQLPAIVEAFTPSAREIALAEQVIGAAARSGGAQRLADGRFVDAPVVRAARRVLSSRRDRHEKEETT
ncbi:HpcH/HpaI aldolase/citrate lyase family protein [Microtetraspora fusca]|uniref:HpcH/HpaI aldolase/citrate lyase family protein n=1 Tax=Microtetraspora fusca TaxID=1997 RepID=UPI00083387DB|nr:aldolase/citrate lyase family protein [Microtetraspora fusca]